MAFGYDYTHSEIGANGEAYITFMTRPKRLDNNGLRYGPAIYILNDHIKNCATVFQFRWQFGRPFGFEQIAVLKEETICDTEVPALMNKLGIIIAE